MSDTARDDRVSGRTDFKHDSRFYRYAPDRPNVQTDAVSINHFLQPNSRCSQAGLSRFRPNCISSGSTESLKGATRRSHISLQYVYSLREHPPKAACEHSQWDPCRKTVLRIGFISPVPSTIILSSFLSTLWRVPHNKRMSGEKYRPRLCPFSFSVPKMVSIGWTSIHSPA